MSTEFEDKAKCFREGSRIMDSLWEALEEIGIAKDHFEASRGAPAGSPTEVFGDRVAGHVIEILDGVRKQIEKSECLKPVLKAPIIGLQDAELKIAVENVGTFNFSEATRQIENAIGRIAEYPYSVLS